MDTGDCSSCSVVLLENEWEVDCVVASVVEDGAVVSSCSQEKSSTMAKSKRSKNDSFDRLILYA